MKWIFSVLLLLLAVGGQSAFAASEVSSEAANWALDKATEDYSNSLRDLQALPEGTPFDKYKVQAEKYFYDSLYMVYRAKVKANITWDSDAVTTNDLTQLVNLGYLKEWPRNPMNAWEPIKVLSASDPASPGDIVFMLPPSSYYTNIKPGPSPVSFMIFIYGPVQGQSRFGQLVLTEKNKAWGSAPSGVLYGWDFHIESESERAERRRKIAEWKKQHPEEAAKQEEEKKKAREQRGKQ